MNQGSEFYDKSMNSWWYDNGIEMNLTHNKEKPVVVERFFRTLTNKITSIWLQYKKICTSINLDEKFDKYNKAYHGTIEMKPADVKVDAYIDYGIKHNDKDFKFRVDGNVRILE